MARAYHRVLLVFVDGIGLAPASDRNPFARHPAPALERLLGGPLTVESRRREERLLLRGIDATLGVSGLPQSATGQAALFTGVNAAALVGRHVTGFPGRRLLELIDEDSLFSRARRAGRSATFANAYSAGYLDALAAGEARESVTTRAVRAAGLALRTLDDLAADRAVTWDVERDLFGRRFGRPPGRRGGRRAAEGRTFSSRWAPRLPPIAARTAGGHLAAIAATYDLTVFETFLADLAGHGRVDLPAAAVVARLDALLDGALAALPPEVTLVVTSDHGNFENAATSTHTRRPVPLLVAGPAAGEFADVEAITGVAPRVLELLDGGARRASS